MKKFYSLLSIISIGALTVFGQQVAKSPVQKMKVNQSASNHHQLPKFHPSTPVSNGRIGNPQNHTAAIIWSDDFSVPSNWTITHAPGTTSDWQIGTTPPSGMYAIPAILSTSAANGYALFDSDLMCDQVNGQIGDLTNATPINCSGHPTVRLRFEESYCRFYDSTYVWVSNDNVNWTMYEVNGTLNANDYAGGGTASSGASMNPVSYSVDITPTAGNQATVYIRFEFYSPMSISATLAGCAYAWMIDDVVLEDLPADDVAMVPSITGEYTGVPLTQAQAVNLEARIANVGPNAETTVGFDVYVLQWDYNLMQYVPLTNASSNTEASLNSGDTSAVLNAGTFIPADTGIYAFAYFSKMDNTDADTTNDFMSSLMVVTDTIYARDNAFIYGGNPDQTIYWTAGGNGSFAIAYEAITDVTITSISTIFWSHTVGDQLTVSIHSITGGIPDTQLGQSQTFTTTAADTGGVFMTFALDPPVTMSPGMFAASIDQITTDPINFWMNNDVHTPGTIFYGGPGAWGLLDTVSDGSGNIIFPNPVFLIRPNLDMSTGVGAIKYASQVDIYPNPSQGKIYIMNNGAKSDMTVDVINNVGQVVYTGKFNQMSNTMVDLSNQPSGVYTVKVKSDKEVTTKSVVISNR